MKFFSVRHTPCCYKDRLSQQGPCAAMRMPRGNTRRRGLVTRSQKSLIRCTTQIPEKLMKQTIVNSFIKMKQA